MQDRPKNPPGNSRERRKKRRHPSEDLAEVIRESSASQNPPQSQEPPPPPNLVAPLGHPSYFERIGGRFIWPKFKKTEGGPNLPWYESTLLWGALGVALGFVLLVVAAMTKDFRYLLIAAWPFALLTVWALFKGVASRGFRRALLIVGWILVTVGLCWLDVKAGSSLNLSAKPPATDPFLVKTTAAFINFSPSTEGASFWISYFSSGANRVSPVPTVVFVVITNTQNIQSLVESVKVQAKTSNCGWFDLIPIDSRTGKFSFAGPGYLNRAAVIDLKDNSLSYKLRDHPIGPHDSVGGWMLLDTTKECETSTGDGVTLKIVLRDAAGVAFEHIESRTLVPDNSHPVNVNGDLQSPAFNVTGEKVDLTAYPEQRYIDRRTIVIPNEKH